MSNPVRRHSTMPSSVRAGNQNVKRNNTSMLSSPLLTEVRSPGFSSRLSALIHSDNNASGVLDSSRPRPYFNAMGNASSANLTPPPGTIDFNRTSSCDR